MIISKKYCDEGLRGFALVAVLWVVMILTGVLVATLSLVKIEADGVVEDTNAYRASMVAHTGLSYAVHPNVERDDPLLRFSSEEYDEGYQVTISPEANRFNLNFILETNDKTLMRNILEYWGMEDDSAAALTDALVDWVDAGDTRSLNGAEKDAYEALGFSGRPYNIAFEDLEDVRLVLGFDAVEKLRPDWRNWFTLRSEGRLDIHEASAEILEVAAEVQASQAEEFVSNSIGIDGVYGTDDDIRFPSVDVALNSMAAPSGDRRAAIARRFLTAGQILRVESVGRSGSFNAHIIATVQKQGSRLTIMDFKEQVSEE